MYSEQLITLIKRHNRVYWDWNGTLIDDVDVCIDITNTFLTSKGVEPITKDFYLKNFTIPVVNYYESLNLKDKGISFDEITESFVYNYKNQRAKQKLYSGAERLVSELSNLNVEQLVLSAAHTEELIEQLERYNLTSFITEVSGAGDYSAGCKLERGQKLKSKYGDGIMIGDTVHDIEIGKEMGLETVWVSEGHQCWARIKNLEAVDYFFDRKTGELTKA